MKTEATMEDLKDILRNNRMSTRPEHYSGRGATLADLNSDILAGIHRDIKKVFGKDSAKAFVDMVDKIKVMSATTFIEELYLLFQNGWKVVEKSSDCPGVSVPKDKNGEYDMGAGMLGMMVAMASRGGSDQSMSIKGSFLAANGIAPKERFDSRNGTITAYYS